MLSAVEKGDECVAVGCYIIGYNAFGIINVYITCAKRFTWLLSPKQGRLICSRSAPASSPYKREIHHRSCITLHHLSVPVVFLSADSLLNPVIHSMNNPLFLTLFRRLATLPKSIIVSITLSS